jgi:hypothetical protein
MTFRRLRGRVAGVTLIATALSGCTYDVSEDLDRERLPLRSRGCATSPRRGDLAQAAWHLTRIESMSTRLVEW